jgi:translation initiation factor IF-2
MKKNKDTIIERPPVVVIMGHVDHGKSSLLDYIQKTNIVAGEAGGITQHISAYEARHTDEKGNLKTITFLDTPGHAAFSGMRTRGASLADVAILLVSAEDSVKQQTIEAINIIKENKVPFVVAINKIDLPSANIEKVKSDLLEHEIFVEGYGGNTPVVPISAKAGTGIDDLLETILLVAELEELQGDTSLPATGFILESTHDPKRGISATILIKDGSLSSGSFVVTPESYSSTRIMEDTIGGKMTYAQFSTPVRITGFSNSPEIGSSFQTVSSKKEAEKMIKTFAEENKTGKESRLGIETAEISIPMIIKGDTMGTVEAVCGELAKMQDEKLGFKIIDQGVGHISEADVKLAKADPSTVILGFGVSIEKKAEDMLIGTSVLVKTFDIIYHLTEWIESMKETWKPKQQVVHVLGSVKLLRHFSSTRDKHVCGGRVTSGEIALGSTVRIIRRDTEIGKGKITNLQEGKTDTKIVREGSEFGCLVESKIEPAPGDVLESFTMKYE